MCYYIILKMFVYNYIFVNLFVKVDFIFLKVFLNMFLLLRFLEVRKRKISFRDEEVRNIV